MTLNTGMQVLIYLVVLMGLAKPLGWYMARVFAGQRCGLDRVLRPVERLLYRLGGIDPRHEMDWKHYALALLVFQVACFFVLYGLQRVQGILPLNPARLPSVSPELAFNTAVSFTTNTNWQAYGGESTMSDLTQMLGLSVQNFVSAAVGMAALAALIRGFVGRTVHSIGNFWTDLIRITLYILLPLSLVLAVLLVSQGVVQNFNPYQTVALLEATVDARGNAITEQVIPMGPAASQIAIKQLGTNGGGFFTVNSAHPLENPTPLSNFLELLAILLIPAGLCYTVGILVGDTRQGWVLLTAMTIVLVALLAVCLYAEQQGTPQLAALGVDQTPGAWQSGGNMEGKEVRFGIANSVLWATATTAASNGSVNSMHDSYTPLGGMVPLWLMQLGEVIFGGVGSGLYGMLLFAIVAVFIAGLMVGRTPEYLGKKIETYEMKMASIGILVPPLLVLIGTAIAVVLPFTPEALHNRGPHGLSEVLYAYASAGNNNGSAFAGFGADTPYFNITLGLAMLFARYWVLLPVLAIAGSLARKTYIPPSSGTIQTHGLMFVGLLIATVLAVGALSFIPVLALGPIVEHLMMLG